MATHGQNQPAPCGGPAMAIAFPAESKSRTQTGIISVLVSPAQSDTVKQLPLLFHASVVSDYETDQVDALTVVVWKAVCAHPNSGTFEFPHPFNVSYGAVNTYVVRTTVSLTVHCPRPAKNLLVNPALAAVLESNPKSTSQSLDKPPASS